jgi:glycosyltransferase involved in cell wall biosynthesis
MSSVRRVVLVTTHYPPDVGGAATYFSLLGHALSDQGTQVTVLTTNAPGYPTVSFDRQVVVWRRIPRLGTAPDQLRKWVQAAVTVGWLTVMWLRHQMDVVHSHGSKSVTVGAAIFSSLFRVPVVYDIQDFFSRPKVIRLGTKPRYVATGGTIADRLVGLGIDRDRILVIPSIPPDDARTKIARPEPSSQHCRCLFIGELHHAVKGSDILLEAFVRVHEVNPTAHLDVVGDGPEREVDEAFVRRHGLEEAVTFKGILPPELVQEEIDRADILVLASRSEGMPRIILEAFARGVPVIATRVGGIHEAVRDGDNGLLVPSENPSALADAIIHLAGNPMLRHELGARGRAWIDQLPAWDRLASLMVTFYDLHPANGVAP